MSLRFLNTFLLVSFSIFFSAFSKDMGSLVSAAVPSLYVIVPDTVICEGDSAVIITVLDDNSKGRIFYEINGVVFINQINNGFKQLFVKTSGSLTIFSYEILDVDDNILYQVDTSIVFRFAENSLPTATLSGGGNYCVGDQPTPLSVQFTGSGPWNLFYTQVGVGDISKQFEESSAILSDSEDIELELTEVWDKHCVAEISEQGYVKSFEKPIGSIIGDSVFCEGEAAIYTTQSNNDYKYQWTIKTGGTFDNTMNFLAHNIALNWDIPGNHLVELEVVSINSGCSSGIKSKEITVHPNPIVKTNFDTIVCVIDEAYFDLPASSISENEIYWPDYDFYGQALSINSEGTYNYIETTPSTCTGEGSINVIEKCIPEVFVPEAFTPNGDGINDKLDVYGNYFNLVIYFYNASGDLVYTMGGNSEPWDGLINNTPASMGVYYWQAFFKDSQGEDYSKTGYVTLIR